jgi:hypothetical protein
MMKKAFWGLAAVAMAVMAAGCFGNNEEEEKIINTPYGFRVTQMFDTLDLRVAITKDDAVEFYILYWNNSDTVDRQQFKSGIQPHGTFSPYGFRNGRKYWFWLEAVGKNGVHSALAGPDTLVYDTREAPEFGPVDVWAVKASSNSVTVSWSNVESANKYKVYYRKSTTSNYSETNMAFIDRGSILSTTFSSVTSGKWYFTVKAGNDYGWSNWITEANITLP